MEDIILSSSVKISNLFSGLRRETARFIKNQEGVTAIEYAVIAVAISAMLLAVFGNGDGTFVTAIKEKFDVLSKNIKGTIE